LPGVVKTVLDKAFYDGWDTLGWVVAAAPVVPPGTVPPDAGWTVSQAELDAAITAERALLNSTFLTSDRPVRVPTPQVTQMLTLFAAGHGFSKQSAAGALADDTTTYALGTQSLKLTTTTLNTNCTVQKNANVGPYDLTGKQVVVWIKVDNPVLTASVRILLGSDASTWTNYFNFEAYKNGGPRNPLVANTWTRVTLNFATDGATGTPNRAAINALRVQVKDTGVSGPVNVWFGGIGAFPEPPAGAVSVCFDDGKESQFLTARPIMDAYGIRGTANIIPSGVDDPTFMTLANLHTLQDVHGWEITAHDIDTFDNVAPDVLLARFVALRKWYIDNGFAAGSQHVAYPGGGFDANSLAQVAKVFATGRTIGDNVNHETWPPGNQYLLRCLEVVNTTTTATIATAVAEAVANKSWLIINFHNIVAAPTVATEYSTANFTTVMGNISASGIAVRPLGEVIARGL